MFTKLFVGGVDQSSGIAAENTLGSAAPSPVNSRDTFNNSKVPPSGVDHRQSMVWFGSRGEKKRSSALPLPN